MKKLCKMFSINLTFLQWMCLIKEGKKCVTEGGNDSPPNNSLKASPHILWAVKVVIM